MILTEKLYLTEDRKQVVQEGDKRAAFLLGVPGFRVSDELAKKLGLLPDPETLINQITVHEPEIATAEPIIINRDGSLPRRRGRPPKSI